MAMHRPLSSWVARVLPDGRSLGEVNDGDPRADARNLNLFVEGWERSAFPWSGRVVLALSRPADGLTVVELDEYGTPIATDKEAVALLRRVEEGWPAVPDEVLGLARESLALRYWLLERLDAEGNPPDTVFALLPWDLLDRAIAAVTAALEPGGRLGELVDIRHWLTPAVRGLSGPLEQLDHGLRTGDPDIARQGATTLLTNLRDLPLSRISESSRRALGALVERLGEIPEHRQLAEVVSGRLVDGTSAVPDDAAALVVMVVPTSYLGPGDDQEEIDRARLDLSSSELVAVLGPRAQGRVFRSGTELVVTLSRVDRAVPPLSVSTGEADAVAVPVSVEDRTYRARLPWDRPGLPERLIFRVVS